MSPHRGPVILAALVVAALLVGGCGAQSTTPASTSQAAASGAAASIDAAGTPQPEDTEPASTAIPGFDGWLTLNPGVVDVGETISGFAMTLTKRAEWSGASRGALFYTTIDGDFRLSGTVRATRTSDSSLDPGGDGTVQLAGLMARHEGSAESWVLLEVGGDAKGLTIATSSTKDGVGELVKSAWSDNEADLKLCRTGTTFTFWARTADSDDDWTKIGQAQRPDLKGILQVGSTLSANATPDLTGLFDALTLEPMDPGEDC
ncbi:MAG TPA: hypothetical protein VFP19_10280 [Candidatus Limnocylindrales bacterium]|nr:hypothetical protein [Candidatus Limnocylindrales bacterium]